MNLTGIIRIKEKVATSTEFTPSQRDFILEAINAVITSAAKKPERPMVGNANEIQMYMHCGLCLQEVQEGASDSPRDYARLEMGWTSAGFQVWCNRHDCNVVHVDFEGQKHPANTTRKAH